ncbi:hypothetical protein K504DRAFT_538597 [Pleomassaria siparia CBS 279.74]|uniref:Uncharacterized protein n=1 Tax=Pleomassaria siparia CBS 279.74 TaxID=1314801 RepID=A0A6G1JTB9_9PLEO|nr:hypothetical protein K504DRAFT_538597 [Pleomassaria siparia CBS 279.74]
MPTPPLADPATIIQIPHLALYGAAINLIATGIIVMIGCVVLRHVSYDNTLVAMVTFGTAVINFPIQLTSLSIVQVLVATHRESKSRTEVSFVNGKYTVLGGKQFTRETWSCMMGNLYLSQEPWSTNACSEYHYARYTMTVMTVVSFLIIAVAYFPCKNALFRRSKVEVGKA